MQYVEMVGASLYDDTTRGCTFMFGGIKCHTPHGSFKIVDGVLFIKQYVVKTNLRINWRGETRDQWKTAQPVDERVQADIARAKEMLLRADFIIQAEPELPNAVRNTRFIIADAIRVLDNGIGNAAEIRIAAERHRKP